MDQETWAGPDQSHMLTLCILLYSGVVHLNAEMQKAKFWSLISFLSCALQFCVPTFTVYFFSICKIWLQSFRFFSLNFPELYCILICFRKKRVVSTFNACQMKDWVSSAWLFILTAYRNCEVKGTRSTFPSSSIYTPFPVIVDIKISFNQRQSPSFNNYFRDMGKMKVTRRENTDFNLLLGKSIWHQMVLIWRSLWKRVAIDKIQKGL